MMIVRVQVVVWMKEWGDNELWWICSGCGVCENGLYHTQGKH